MRSVSGRPCTASGSSCSPSPMLSEIAKITMLRRFQTTSDSIEMPEATTMPILGYRAIVEGFIHLHELHSDQLGDDRGVSLPSHTVTAEDMIQAVTSFDSNRRLGKISVQPDPFIVDIVKTWPPDAEWQRAQSLGFPVDGGLNEIIGNFIEDYLDA